MFGPEGNEYIVKKFKRFVDDVFCLWDNENVAMSLFHLIQSII